MDRYDLDHVYAQRIHQGCLFRLLIASTTLVPYLPHPACVGPKVLPHPSVRYVYSSNLLVREAMLVQLGHQASGVVVPLRQEMVAGDFVPFLVVVVAVSPSRASSSDVCGTDSRDYLLLVTAADVVAPVNCFVVYTLAAPAWSVLCVPLAPLPNLAPKQMSVSGPLSN